MDSRVVATVVMGIAASIVFLAFFWYPAHKEKKYSDRIICENILACKGYGIVNPKNLHTPLESRAIPNERLVRAYGIDNAFTTSDDTWHKEFSKEAGKRINMTEDEVGTVWREPFPVLARIRC